MRAAHIPRAGDEESSSPGAVVVGPQVWADSFRQSAGALPSEHPVEAAFERLAELLERADSTVSLIAKIDAYVDSEENARSLRAIYKTTFTAPRPVLQIQVADIWGPDPVLLDVVAGVRA